MKGKLRTLFTSALVVVGLVAIPAVASANTGEASASIEQRGGGHGGHGGGGHAGGGERGGRGGGERGGHAGFERGGRGGFERGGRGFDRGRFERGHWDHGRWIGARWYVGGAYYDYDYCAVNPYANICVW